MPIDTRNREGFALAAAIMAIVVIGALIAGAFFSSTQEYRMGRNTLVQHRSFAVAEYGLNRTVADWDKFRINMVMKNGQIDSTTFNQVLGPNEQARVKVTRLNEYSFWVVSEGVAGRGPTASRSRTGALLKLAYPSVRVGGALTANANVNVRGNSRIAGQNVDPAGWGSDCLGITGRDTAGVVMPPWSEIRGAERVSGNPPVVKDSLAGRDSTYIKYGDENWNTLTRNADKVFTSDIAKPWPSITADGRCNTPDPNNWGEPFRSPPHTGTVYPQCSNYFPIIYMKTNMTLNANHRGQGILMVEGSLTVNGTFDFAGLIIVRDDVNSKGTLRVQGAMLARKANLNKQDDGVEFAGTSDLGYSACAIERALRGSAIVLPARERAWAQLF